MPRNSAASRGTFRPMPTNVYESGAGEDLRAIGIDPAITQAAYRRAKKTKQDPPSMPACEIGGLESPARPAALCSVRKARTLHSKCALVKGTSRHHVGWTAPSLHCRRCRDSAMPESRPERLNGSPAGTECDAGQRDPLPDCLDMAAVCVLSLATRRQQGCSATSRERAGTKSFAASTASWRSDADRIALCRKPI